ncbi:hypothetical protein SAMN05216360_10791 [Methylobacterium phyllostachyos]|uniref:Replication region DNA-binding N-term n=1 Tax=Methylobacterium phyllostachyos TaxID=582672 RepID=A0A1H0A7K6_9HYPH|nr:hypothetical protein [Methylobacterium phyllostachyos]SDN29184.1 hypothetical protein SAMN05216360_10791 [Methylobacterium phyllostachyos]
MSDRASIDAAYNGSPNVMMRAWQAKADATPEKVVSFLGLESRNGAVATIDGPAEGVAPAPTREWASAVDLIREASEAIRVGEERASELEAQLAQVVAQADLEIRRLEQEVATGAQNLARSEERVRLAEARAAEAEDWLVRLHDAAVEAFGARAKPIPAPSTPEEAE